MIHAIRLGTHAEKDYLVRGSQWFSEVVINANLLEATSGASGIFLISLEKPYSIDPVTYSFGQDPHYLMNTTRGEVKRTFRALSERFGEPLVDSIREKRRVTPADFSDLATREAFCERVLRYQESRVAEALAENEAFLEEGVSEFPPVRLIAPYFYNDAKLTWLDTNRSLAETCISRVAEGFELWVVVSFDGLLLDRTEDMDRLIETYDSLPCLGFLFWPSDFDESRATVSQVKGLRRLAQSLCSSERRGMMLYGGYFAALLKDEGIAGISHGVGYGEKRDIVPVVGGGMPPAKYYLRGIHDDISITDFLRLTEGMDEATFERDVCNCTICSELVHRGGLSLLRSEFGATKEKPYVHQFRRFPTPRVYQLTRFHYIENKHLELEEINENDRESLAAGLAQSYDRFSEYLGYGQLGHLLRWQQGLLEQPD